MPATKQGIRFSHKKFSLEETVFEFEEFWRLKRLAFKTEPKWISIFFSFFPIQILFIKFHDFFFSELYKERKELLKNSEKKFLREINSGFLFFPFIFEKFWSKNQFFDFSNSGIAQLKKLFLICPWENHWWWKLKQINFFSQCIGLLQRKWNFKNIFPSREDIWTKYWWAK